MTIVRSKEVINRSSTASRGRAYRGDLRRTIARRRRSKDLAGSLHQVERKLMKAAKTARTLVLRNIIRKKNYSEERKANLINNLKSTSHNDIGKKAFDAIRGGNLDDLNSLVGRHSSSGGGDCADAAAILVLQHSSMRAVIEECANRIKSVLATIERKEAARREREAASARTAKHFSEEHTTRKSLFVESLAESSSQDEEEEEEARKKRKNEANRLKKLRRSSRPTDLSIYMPVSHRPLEKQRPRVVSENRDTLINFSDNPQKLHRIASTSMGANHHFASSAAVASSAVTSLLHPSWEAKKLLKEKLAYTKTVHQGKKIVFNEDD